MFALVIVTAILNALLLSALAVKLLHVFQLGGYRTRLFARWTFMRITPYMLTLITLSVVGFGGAWTLQMFLKGYWAYFGLLVFWGMAGASIYLRSRMPVKVPFKYTPRARRLLGVIFLLNTAASFTLLFFAGVQFAPLVAVLLPIFVLLANYLLFPVEWLIRRYYLLRATRKLFSPEYAELIRIGITGSYGKTSCKNILAAMLSQKYKTVASPHSFNTPMGFCKTVNRVLQPGTEILIMEMGARYRGDIRKMCQLFKPMHGMLTSIGLAHLETLKTPENIKAEKYELVNALPAEGIRVIGGDTPDNIALCTEMARALGVTDKQIADAIATLEPTPHRLQHITTEHGVHILDDSYNSNPHGAAAALEMLKQLKTKHGGSAIVLTPGMVELGKYQYTENHKFGQKIAAVADKVIIIGDLNRDALRDGLAAAGFQKENVLFSKTLEDSKKLYAPLLHKNDVLLIENDLPDNFV